MSDQRLSIAQDLSAIEDMYARLHGEAINRAGDPDIPGGAAMVMLGPGADVEAWGYVQLSSMFGRLRLDAEEQHAIETQGIEPPLSFLASWADIVREERGQEPSQRRAKIGDEIRYLRSAIDWMLSVNDDGEPWWLPVEDFSTRLHQVRSTLENVLKAGTRSERINGRCNQPSEKACKRPRLIRERAEREGDEDSYRCPDCGASGAADWVAQCWHRMVAEKGDAPEWVTVKVAAAATGRSPKTIRRWTEPRKDGSAKVAKREEGRQIEVNWPDVRAAHDTSQVRPWQIAS